MIEVASKPTVQKYISVKKVNKIKTLLEIIDHFGNPDDVIWQNKAVAKKAIDAHKDSSESCDTCINAAYYLAGKDIHLIYRIYNDRLGLWKYFSKKYDTMADEALSGEIRIITA